MLPFMQSIQVKRYLLGQEMTTTNLWKALLLLQSVTKFSFYFIPDLLPNAMLL